MIEESGMTNFNTVTAPGIAHYKPTVEDEALLDHEQHKRYRRIVGKLQWLAYTRPDIADSTKELARDLTAPTEFTTRIARHQALQIHHRTNNNTQSKHQQHPGSRRSCQCRLGRMPYYQEINFRFQHHLFRTNSCIWQQNTSYNSTQLSRV